MKVRLAVNEDLPVLKKIFARARDYMVSIGDPNQWGDGYPDEKQILSDMDDLHCYVILDDSGRVCATFCFIIGEDPYYGRIDDGAWLDEDSLYGTIHRIASDGTVKGVFHYVLDWCMDRCPNIRIDTHPDNSTMLHLVGKEGFSRCGIIYVRNNGARIAFQKIG